MGKALYRQYRSTSFDEVIGQDHITTTLKNSLANGSFGHAYLLTGPRGVGKTSVARILAFAVNGLPYQNDSIHLDIIEIDAASNRRIDEIRSLRERVYIAPTSGQYKVYIIDEVHMLTREAFNALLKTLEEPPTHVIFILATTEIHKLPDTIVSRCITFTFKPIDNKNIVSHLKYIAKSENFKITDTALHLLAKHGEGSFRDSISLLDQVKNSGNNIDAKDIELALGLASKESVEDILKAVQNGDPKHLATSFQAAYDNGASETNLSKQIAEVVRADLLAKKSIFNSEDALHILSDLLDVPASPKPRSKLELCLLAQLFKRNRTDAVAVADQAVVVERKEINIPQFTEQPVEQPTQAIADKPKQVNEDTISLEISDMPAHKAKPIKNETADDSSDELWDNVLLKLKSQNNTLYGIARMAESELRKDELLLTFKFPFHFRQVNQAKNKSIILKIIKDLGHKNLQLTIIQKTDSVKVFKKVSADPAMTNITNIFGDSEVLES